MIRREFGESGSTVWPPFSKRETKPRNLTFSSQTRLKIKLGFLFSFFQLGFGATGWSRDWWQTAVLSENWVLRIEATKAEKYNDFSSKVYSSLMKSKRALSWSRKDVCCCCCCCCCCWLLLVVVGDDVGVVVAGGGGHYLRHCQTGGNISSARHSLTATWFQKRDP